MTRIGIILGSTRPQRVGEQVARWVLELAAQRGDADYELIDLRDHPLPHLDEPLSPMLGQYQQPHTLAWAATIGACDGFVFVTPEYNHGTSGAFKNAIDFLHAEWADKAVGIVSYGIAGGTGAAFQLRQICGQLGMADVSRQLPLNLRTDFEGYVTFTPGPHSTAALGELLDQVAAWTAALAPLRSSTAVAS